MIKSIPVIQDFVLPSYIGLRLLDNNTSNTLLILWHHSSSSSDKRASVLHATVPALSIELGKGGHQHTAERKRVTDTHKINTFRILTTRINNLFRAYCNAKMTIQQCEIPSFHIKTCLKVIYLQELLILIRHKINCVL